MQYVVCVLARRMSAEDLRAVLRGGELTLPGGRRPECLKRVRPKG